MLTWPSGQGGLPKPTHPGIVRVGVLSTETYLYSLYLRIITLELDFVEVLPFFFLFGTGGVCVRVGGMLTLKL